MMNQLPNFQCGTCGQCEKDYYKYQNSQSTVGFCHKFKETTSLSEKNIKCWTSKEIDFADVFDKEEKRKTANDFKNQVLAKRKKIDFTNQISMF